LDDSASKYSGYIAASCNALGALMAELQDDSRALMPARDYALSPVAKKSNRQLEALLKFNAQRVLEQTKYFDPVQQQDECLRQEENIRALGQIVLAKMKDASDRKQFWMGIRDELMRDGGGGSL